jgi:hypothetical protein
MVPTLLTGARGSVAELGSALGSAAGEDLAAVGGLHSLAEAVLFLALELLGLVGTKHFLHSFQVIILNIAENREVVDKKSLDG